LVGVEIEEAGALEIARRARGTPRIANRLLRRVRDYAEVKADGVISEKVAAAALDMLDVDRLGLDNMDSTPRGRVATQSAWRTFGLKAPESALAHSQGMPKVD